MLDFLVGELRKRGLSGATINRKLSAMSKMLTHAVRRKLISSKPKIEKEPETQHRERWLTDDEEKKLLGWLLVREARGYHDLFLLMIDQGLRLSEAVRLKWEDVQDGYTRVWGNTSKNGKSRSVPHTQRVADMLSRRYAARPPKEERVFHDTLYWGAEHIWKQAREVMGLTKDTQFVIHCLRHTFCSRLVQRGVQLGVVQKLAGHKTIQTTIRYAHLDDDALRSAIQKMEEGPRITSGQIRLGPKPDTTATTPATIATKAG